MNYLFTDLDIQKTWKIQFQDHFFDTVMVLFEALNHPSSSRLIALNEPFVFSRRNKFTVNHYRIFFFLFGELSL